MDNILVYIALAIISAIGGLLIAELKQQKAQRKGIQALLRDRLYDIYYKCMKKGYATNVEKNNFENLYLQYHALGRNGVMDVYRKQIMELPLRKVKNAKSV